MHDEVTPGLLFARGPPEYKPLKYLSTLKVTMMTGQITLQGRRIHHTCSHNPKDGQASNKRTLVHAVFTMYLSTAKNIGRLITMYKPHHASLSSLSKAKVRTTIGRNGSDFKILFIDASATVGFRMKQSSSAKHVGSVTGYKATQYQ